MSVPASRRILAITCAALLAAPWSRGADSPRPEAKYNFLFCFADDWGRYAGAYAGLDGRPTVNDLVRTPHLDRLAREGVLYRHAFVPAPSCTPCRSSVVSGRYWWNTGLGAILRGARWDAAIPSFPLLLRDAGYHIGKTHKVWSPGEPADGPFDGQAHAYEAAGKDMDIYSQKVTDLMAGGQNRAAAHNLIMGQVRANFTSFLRDRAPGQPWLYWFGPVNTHRSWAAGSGRALWGLDPDRLAGRLPGQIPDVPAMREDFADYLGECQAWDAALGVLLEELERSGELERTIIIVSGDHGVPGFPGGKCNVYDLGSAVALIARVPGRPGGRIINDFVSLVDLAPTVLDLAGLPAPAGVDGRSFRDSLDSERAGQVAPDRSFVLTGRERHVAEARPGLLPYPMRALRTADYLYIRNFAPERWPMGAPLEAAAPTPPTFDRLLSNTRAAFPDMDSSPAKAWLITHRDDPAIRPYYDRALGLRPAEELYDLRADPDQLHNLAADPRHAATRAELADKLIGELRRFRDPRVTGDGAYFDRPPFTDPAPPLH